MKQLKLILELLPVVLQVIQAIELLLGPSNGDVKKSLVMEAVKLANSLDSNASEVDVVSVLVDRMVQVYNKSGVFISQTRDFPQSGQVKEYMPLRSTDTRFTTKG